MILKTSVADTECSSQIPGPNFFPSRILVLGFRIQQQQKRRGKYFFSYLFLAINFTKVKIILLLKRFRKQFEPPNKESIYPRNCSKLSEILVEYPGPGIRDLRSGKNLSWIPDPGPGSKNALGPGSLIWIPNTVKSHNRGCMQFKDSACNIAAATLIFKQIHWLFVT